MILEAINLRLLKPVGFPPWFGGGKFPGADREVFHCHLLRQPQKLHEVMLPGLEQSGFTQVHPGGSMNGSRRTRWWWWCDIFRSLKNWGAEKETNRESSKSQGSGCWREPKLAWDSGFLVSYWSTLTMDAPSSWQSSEIYRNIKFEIGRNWCEVAGVRRSGTLHPWCNCSSIYTLEDERLEPTNHPWKERKMIWTFHLHEDMFPC